MKQWLSRMDQTLASVEKIIIVTSLVVMTLAVFLQVVLRYGFSVGLPWAEELARYLMIWSGFFGASLATRARRHLKIDFLSRAVRSESLRSSIQRCALAISGLFCAFFCGLGAILVHHSYVTGRHSPAMEIPIWWVQLSIPLAAGLMALRFVGQTFGELPKQEDRIEGVRGSEKI
ncbi:MAG: TRAP transporter small permease [Deltaproteobacteria bacterium]|nr:TRAP transporter small permease [Deltaproteobacteria bacterium]